VAVDWYRGNLASANFPFATELWGRSVIVNGQDQNYDRTTLNAPGVVVDKGIPQVFYMHNCLPTNQGYQSIGYMELGPAAPGPVTTFDTAYPIQVANQARYIFVPAGGSNWIYNGATGAWSSISPVSNPYVTTDTQVTTAFVAGQTYIYYSQFGCFIYDNINNVLTEVTLSGVNAFDIKGVCAANGYMIVWDDSTVAWSGVTEPTDFTPSLITGAGGGSVSDAKGKILVCLPLVNGFIIYCENNAVGARYMGNAQFPYIMREIPGSSGIANLNQVSWHANLPYHIVWAGDGLTQQDLQSSTLVYPECSDFIAGKLYEDFDETTLTLSQEYLTNPVFTNVNIISGRFLVLSYGLNPGEYTFAIVRDLLLNRYGKLKVNHVSCFEWNDPSVFIPITYGQLGTTTYGALNATTYGDLNQVNNPTIQFKQTFAFMQSNGFVQAVDFDLGEGAANGVMILGKFQLDRNDFVEHQEFTIDTVDTANTFNYYILPSYDGKTLLPAVPGFLFTDSAQMRRYKKMISCMNFSCLLKGAFHATSFLLCVSQGGKN
jgi:hypothetical protein